MLSNIEKVKKLIPGFVLILLSLNPELLAQKATSGVFLSADDFVKNKISFANTKTMSAYKIHLHKLVSIFTIKIVHGDSVVKLRKETIFGYRDSKMNDFRIVHGQEYKIQENKSLVIYSANQRVYFGGGHMQSSIMVPVYYFSLGPEGKIQPLTIPALKKAFPDNLKFHDLLDVEFGDGAAISDFNREQNMFQVNFLFKKSNS